MKACSCVGINVTWACNAHCRHCFYRRNEKFAQPDHRSLQEILNEAHVAKMRGCDRAVLIGQGEPLLHPQIREIIAGITELGMYSNVITNGTLPVGRYEDLFANGLDHIQISAHGLGNVLDEIIGVPGAGDKQKQLFAWLNGAQKPFRTNTSMQQLNYKSLPQIAEFMCVMKANHVALLGFLPHYEWKEHAGEVAVHPAILRPYIEQAAAVLEEYGCLFTIRYHPLCHLSSRYWKHVVNARYVLFDPWEWDYGYFHTNNTFVWNNAMQLGESVAIKGQPCSECVMRLHCGGWNRHYAEAFAGADLFPIKKVPFEYDHVALKDGGLHDLNPANSHCGHLGGEKR